MPTSYLRGNRVRSRVQTSQRARIFYIGLFPLKYVSNVRIITKAFSSGNSIFILIGRRKYGSTVRTLLKTFLPSRNMNSYYDPNVRILIHKYYLFAFAFSSSRRLSSFNTATASLIVRGRLSYARRWLNRSATEIILLSAALPVLRTAAESGEGSPERRDEGTARQLDYHDDAERTTPTFSLLFRA